MKIKLPVESNTSFDFGDKTITYNIQLKKPVTVSVTLLDFTLNLEFKPYEDFSIETLKYYLYNSIRHVENSDLSYNEKQVGGLIEKSTALLLATLVYDTFIENEDVFKDALNKQIEKEKNQFLSELNYELRNILGNNYVFEKYNNKRNYYTIHYRVHDKNALVLIVNFDEHTIINDFPAFKTLSNEQQMDLYDLIFSKFKMEETDND